MSNKKYFSSVAVSAFRLPFALLLWTGLCGGLMAAPLPVAPDAVFSVRAEGQRLMVRALTRAPTCPDIEWDGAAALPMRLRAAPATVVARTDSEQKDSKAAVFDVLTCEAAWPAGVARARVAGIEVPGPTTEIKRIVVIADTGCRMKASENAFQSCNDAQQWPFAQIAQSAVALKPDLVVHIGDIHYRESPCAAGNEGCAGSPWGYGYDTWLADLFKPAEPLLRAAPWVFVRGNHESCKRAGQGWFRFVDPQPWSEARSCNEARLDRNADGSTPYAVEIAADAQLVVFDSATTQGHAFSSSDVQFKRYASQLQDVAALTQKKPHSLFLSHHPLLAIAPGKEGGKLKFGGNAGLLSVFETAYPDRLFPTGIDVTLHGHLHLFEAISFKSERPVSLIMGNAGSANEGEVPLRLPPGTEPYPGAIIEDYAARAEYGFATLDKMPSDGASHWLLTEYNTLGKPVIRCDIVGSKSRCVSASQQ